MVITGPILLRENISDFTNAAVHMEKEIKSLGLTPENKKPVETRPEVKFNDLWLSKKTVSLFNLGIALELMLKLIRVLNDIPTTKEHSLTKLYDGLPDKVRHELEGAYQTHAQGSLDTGRFICMRARSSKMRRKEKPPVTPNILTLRDFFDYFDTHVLLFKKRYSWEDVASEAWNYYIDDISLFVKLIDNVLISIKLR